MLPTQAELAAKATAARVRAAEDRRQRVIQLHIAGMSVVDIADRLGVSRRTIHRDLADTEDIRVDAQAIIEDACVDAHDLHLRLTEMLDADIADLYDEQGNIKPIRQWPRVWRQGLAIEITEEDLSERSSDGVQAGESRSWDKAGVRRKLKVYDRAKLIEIAGRLKPVDAFAAQGASAKEIAGEVMSEIDKRIAEGRQRASQRAQIAGGDVIETTPTK